MGGFVSKIIDPIGAITGIDGLGIDPGGAALEAAGVGKGSTYGKYLNPAGATVRAVESGDFGAMVDPLDDFGLKKLELPEAPALPTTQGADIAAEEERKKQKKRFAARSGTMLTGGGGLLGQAPTRKKTLLGQ